MVHYKLYYFDVRGVGEIARKVLAYANVPFEDIRISEEEWPNLKKTTLFGHLPVLEEDGKVLAESFAIARYLARKYGLAGADEWEAAQIDSIADFTKEFHWENFRPYILTAIGWIPGNKEEHYENLLVPAFEKYMPIFIRLLNESGSGFFAKSGVSWVDFYVASLIEGAEGVDANLLAKYPEILKHKSKVYSLPQLKKYMETTPKTKF